MRTLTSNRNYIRPTPSLNSINRTRETGPAIQFVRQGATVMWNGGRLFEACVSACRSRREDDDVYRGVESQAIRFLLFRPALTFWSKQPYRSNRASRLPLRRRPALITNSRITRAIRGVLRTSLLIGSWLVLRSGVFLLSRRKQQVNVVVSRFVPFLAQHALNLVQMWRDF